jgi:hypothetical protein
MSQLRIMRDGKPDWLKEGPARARVSKYGQGNLHSLTLIGGSLVKGDPDPIEQNRRTSKEWRQKR